jgi:acetyl/propionyl-CoA carboxylase alpha subunit
MKHFVRIGEQELVVNLGGEGVHFGEEIVQAHVEDVSGTPVHMVTIGTEVHRVLVRKDRERGKGCYSLWVGGYRFDVEALDERSKAIRELSGERDKPSGPAPVIAPMPGLIVRVNVQVGDEVQSGQGIVVMEAMKMENELRSSSSGRVKSILAQPGTAVEKGAKLVELE